MTILEKFAAGACAIALGATISVAPSQAAEVKWVRTIPLDLAMEAAQAALADCRKQGSHPSVGVMDIYGEMKVLLIDDNSTRIGQKALPKILYLSVLAQANTMAIYSRPGQGPRPEIGSFQGVVEMIDPGKALAAPGALPILIGKDFVGSIGVSGSATGELDNSCAMTGLNKIKDRLR